MDCCLLSYNHPHLLQSFPSAEKVVNPFLFSVNFLSGHRLLHRPTSLSAPTFNSGPRAPPVVAASGQCEFGCSLNTPIEPESQAGKFLRGVLQNDREFFHVAVGKQLDWLVIERGESVARMNLCSASAVASLHRRIAELKKLECRTAIEDVMYMIIFYNFSEIRVRMIPRLCKCIYNGRLEIWPSRECWELESIHSSQVLEMVREHLAAVLGWRSDSNVTSNWTKTKIQRLKLHQAYAASIFYGYFLKSTSLRLRLEMSLEDETSPPRPPTSPCMFRGKLRRCVMGFDQETMRTCATPRSKEAESLIERHSYALFGGDEEAGLADNGGAIFTSLASLKRFVMEAVAFGSFLWEAEEYVNHVYKLEEN